MQGAGRGCSIWKAFGLFWDSHLFVNFNAILGFSFMRRCPRVCFEKVWTFAHNQRFGPSSPSPCTHAPMVWSFSRRRVVMLPRNPTNDDPVFLARSKQASLLSASSPPFRDTHKVPSPRCTTPDRIDATKSVTPNHHHHHHHHSTAAVISGRFVYFFLSLAAPFVLATPRNSLDRFLRCFRCCRLAFSILVAWPTRTRR